MLQLGHALLVAHHLTPAPRKTTVRLMPSLTVKIPASLDKKLRSTASKRREQLSTLARRALEKEVTAAPPDFVQLAAGYKGMFRGPRDLSMREGYGR